MNPRVSEAITVSVPNPLISLLTNTAFIIVAILFGLGLTVFGIARRNARKEEERRKRMRTPPPLTLTPTVSKEKPPSTAPQMNVVYCIYCGEKLPLDATYCRKCGRKIQ